MWTDAQRWIDQVVRETFEGDEDAARGSGRLTELLRDRRGGKGRLWIASSRPGGPAPDPLDASSTAAHWWPDGSALVLVGGRWRDVLPPARYVPRARVGGSVGAWTTPEIDAIAAEISPPCWTVSRQCDGPVWEARYHGVRHVVGLRTLRTALRRIEDAERAAADVAAQLGE